MVAEAVVSAPPPAAVDHKPKPDAAVIETSNEDDKNNNKTIEWLESSCLSVVVVGASGDLAKKKTFPSLLNLYADHLLPKDVTIFGFARSAMTDDELRDRLRPYLEKSNQHAKNLVAEFLLLVRYRQGNSYGDKAAFAAMTTEMQAFEQTSSAPSKNRLFYFAIPPSAFAETALAIKETSMQDESLGWSRLIVEKPFGQDLQSFEELNQTLSTHFEERHLYRIDHYLGKEIVQNLTVLRFSNIWLERVWNADNIKCIMLTFKENFGTEGRGGYFDQYGIIRDILQNHLLQVLTLMCMDPPFVVEGPRSGRAIRDAKVQVLNAMDVIQLEDVVLGQYEGYAGTLASSSQVRSTPRSCSLSRPQK
jgi:glucose-6-phosphate 1-dehydrogenase